MVGRGFSLPAEDRSPADGELFSVEDLYLTQTEEFRREYGHSMAVVFARERRLLQELHDEAQDLSSERVLAQTREREDRIIRALGQMSLAFRTFDNLSAGRPTLPPQLSW